MADLTDTLPANLEGELTAPFAQSVSKGEHWYLIYREGRQDEAAFQAFRAWIVRAAARPQARRRGEGSRRRNVAIGER